MQWLLRFTRRLTGAQRPAACCGRHSTLVSTPITTLSPRRADPDDQHTWAVWETFRSNVPGATWDTFIADLEHDNRRFDAKIVALNTELATANALSRYSP